MATHVLLQYGEDPFNTKFEDIESRLAFTISEVDRNPNVVVKIAREAPWAQQHPDIMGPSSSFLYFGPSKTKGYFVYGNGPTHPMTESLRQKKESSTSRYFTAQNGKDYKWKIAPSRMECTDGRNVLAVWELSQHNEGYGARLTIKHPALPIVTEILTSLSLNRMAQHLHW